PVIVLPLRPPNPTLIPYTTLFRSNIQLPTLASPDALVVCAVPVALPPPLATVNVTDTPETGLLNASFTITRGGVVTDVFTVADWPSPAFLAICVASPAVPVAVNVS